MGVPMTVSPEHFFRGAVAKESAWKTPGSYVQFRGLMRGSNVTPDRERIPIEAALNSTGDKYADIHGAQTYAASFMLYLHAAWFTDYADLFESVFGTKSTTASPTFAANGDNFTMTVSGNATAGIVKLTGSDSKTYICPVDIDAGGTSITLGIGLPTGITATAIVNPGSASGAEFICGNVAGAPFTFTIETDWSATPSSTTQRNVLASGCTMTSFLLQYDRGAPLTLATTWIGASYTDDGGAAANISDPTAWTAEGPSWTGDFFLTADTSPKWGDTQARIKSWSFEYSPTIIVERGAQGIDGGSNGSSLLAGSDITGYTRDAPVQDTLKIRTRYDSAMIASFTSQSIFRFFGVMYPGTPGAAPGSQRTAVYFRRCKPVGTVVVVVEDGARYADLEFAVERDTTSNTNQERFVLARFN